jgi:hypothetical protein
MMMVQIQVLQLATTRGRMMVERAVLYINVRMMKLSLEENLEPKCLTKISEKRNYIVIPKITDFLL